MNVLSALSVILYTAFFIGAGHILVAERKSSLNFSAGATLLSLGWWSFCNSFFFAAATAEEAFFWHKLGALGWCGFVVLAAYYFFALTHNGRMAVPLWKRALFFAPAVVLIVHNLFGKTTSLAQAIIPSSNGWGWTYQNSAASFWLWAYLGYVVLYFGFAFLLLIQWAKAVEHKMKKEMAVKFIVLDLLTIFCGTITDVVLPLTLPAIPALASLATALFGLGYFAIIYRHDVFNIDLVISSDDILQISNNTLFVMDENKEILKCSKAVSGLLGFDKSELIGTDFTDLVVTEINLAQLRNGEDISCLETKLRCKDDSVKDVLLSASVAKDKRHSFLCLIVSCQDISKQKQAQQELELLAKDYQMLAYYDPLTALPNRRLFLDTLHDFETLYRAKRQDFAVIFLDLDNFKQANERFGHQGGDELLIAAAKKLQTCAREEEFVARLGGDEFVIITPCAAEASMERKLQRIGQEFRQPIPFCGKPYEIKTSAGYGIFSQTGDLTRLIQKADEAMYRSKKEKGVLSERPNPSSN